ncbi:MAG TPA: VOC family protein [Vicinamibacterales bacterium]|jgi:glyoxylase I family protein|nr:VOC family protein [Vicinamibacterales bacterium]
MPTLRFSHVAFSCKDPIAVERFYTKHFGFKRGRVYLPGPGQVVVITAGDVAIELFPATGQPPGPTVLGAGPEYQGFRHFAFLVDDLDKKIAEMGADAKVTLGPLDMSQFIPGMRVAWLADPEGNIVELNQGYVDEANPPALT